MSLSMSLIYGSLALKALTRRPSYHPEAMLKIYMYSYLNRVPSAVVLTVRHSAISS